jgi:hypothetical protein
MCGHIDVTLRAARISFDCHEPRPVGAGHESGVNALCVAVSVLLYLYKDVTLAWLAVELPGFFTPSGDVGARGGITPRHLVVTVSGSVHAPGNEVGAPELLSKSEVRAVLLLIATYRVFPNALLAER